MHDDVMLNGVFRICFQKKKTVGKIYDHSKITLCLRSSREPLDKNYKLASLAAEKKCHESTAKQSISVENIAYVDIDLLHQCGISVVDL